MISESFFDKLQSSSSIKSINLLTWLWILQSPARSAFTSSPDTNESTLAIEHYLQDVDDMTKRRFWPLLACFPSVTPPVLLSALSVSKGKLSFAKDVRPLLHPESVPKL